MINKIDEKLVLFQDLVKFKIKWMLKAIIFVLNLKDK